MIVYDFFFDAAKQTQGSLLLIGALPHIEKYTSRKLYTLLIYDLIFSICDQSFGKWLDYVASVLGLTDGNMTE